MEYSKQTGELMHALAEVQRRLGPVVKDGKNPHYRHTYATLKAVMESCREPLAAAGLMLIQTPVGGVEGCLRLLTELRHLESGQWLRFALDMPLGAGANAQAVGSAITYGRRYAITTVLGMVMEDDDGNAACRRETARDQFFGVLREEFGGDTVAFSQELGRFFRRPVESSAELNDGEMLRFVRSRLKGGGSRG